MADVEVIATYELFNINRIKLEKESRRECPEITEVNQDHEKTETGRAKRLANLRPPWSSENQPPGHLKSRKGIPNRKTILNHWMKAFEEQGGESKSESSKAPGRGEKTARGQKARERISGKCPENNVVSARTRHLLGTSHSMTVQPDRYPAFLLCGYSCFWSVVTHTSALPLDPPSSPFLQGRNRLEALPS
jgi:hypothetical protein